MLRSNEVGQGVVVSALRLDGLAGDYLSRAAFAMASEGAGYFSERGRDSGILYNSSEPQRTTLR